MKPQKLSITFLVTIGLLVLPTLSLAQGKSAYQEGKKLQDKNKFKEAILKYNEAINKEPDNYKYYYQRGKCQYALERYTGAKTSFEQCVKHRANFGSGYAWLARTYQRLERSSEAIRNYELAAEYESKGVNKLQYYLRLINLLIEESQFDKAKDALKEAEPLSPSNENILYFKGRLAAEEGKHKEATNYYERALNSGKLAKASNTVKAKYYYALGLSRKELGDDKGAQAAFKNASFGAYAELVADEKAAAGPAYHYKLAYSYYFSEAYDESEKYINKVIADKKDYSGAYVLKAKIAQRKGNLNGAIQLYNKAGVVEKDPSKRSKIQIELASLQLLAGRPASAMSTIRSVGVTDSKIVNSSKYLSVLAKILYKNDKYEETIETLDKLLAKRIDPKLKAKYSFLLGQACKKAGMDEKAKEAFKAAMKSGAYQLAAEYEMKEIN
ncbi:MAG: tetratricopeptide repeat protein [Bacteroidota bacterium]